MTLSVPRLLLSFFVAIAILPAVARADSGLPQVPVPASDALTTAAHALAVAHWGVEPCAGQVTVTWAPLGPGSNARSTWMSYDIRNPLTYTQCAISYNLDVDWDWPKLCTVIEHELGHLAGHDHVNDPHDVMSPYYVYPTPECAAGGAPIAAPAPVTTAEAPAVTPAASKATASKAATKKKAKGKVSKRKAAARTTRAKARSARSARARKAGAKKAGTRGAVRAAAAESSTLALLLSCPFGAL